MRNLPRIAMLSFLVSTCFTRCGLDCIDKKTGMHHSSSTLQEAKENKVFQFELLPYKSTYKLDSRLSFDIKSAWVENSWKYECIDNKAEVVKDTSYQFVVDADYSDKYLYSDYWLGNNQRINGLGATLNYRFTGQDTITLTLYKDTSYTLTKNRQVVDSITFVKRQTSR
jgi:hypothetical protein